MERGEERGMFERFTDRARKVMQLANQEAQRLNHEYIGTDHILLGLVKEGAGVAANVLKNLNIDLNRIRLEVEKIVQSGPEQVVVGKLPITPRAKQAIEFSIEEARLLNHNYVGTEHILLGLLREPDTVAGQVLMNLLLKSEDVRCSVIQLLGTNSPVVAHLPAPEHPIITAEDSAKCRRARGMGLWTPLRRGVSWGCRHGDLSTFLAGFGITLIGSLVAWSLESENVNAGALLAGSSYIFAIALAYWPYWDRRPPGKSS